MPSTPIAPATPIVEDISPEMNFLLGVLQADWAEDRAHALKPVVDHILDWRKMLRVAMYHGVLDLIYQRVRQFDVELLPESLLQSLHANNQISAQKNLFLSAELIKIIRLLESEGVDVVSIKGPLLGSYLYDNISLRPFGDLDIVVRKEDILKAKQLLVQDGFRPSQIMSADEEIHLVNRQYALTLLKSKGDFQIVAELHWALTHRFFSFRFYAEEMWERTSQRELSGVEITTLSNPLLLLFLCVHGAKHDWNRLIWLMDVQHLSERLAAEEWDELIDLAERTRSVRMITVGLALSERVLGGTYPASIQTLIDEDRKTVYWVDRLTEFLARGNLSRPRKLTSMRFQTGVREHVNDRWGSYRQQTKLLFTPTDKDRDVIRLPGLLSPLYYVIRPVRIIVERTIRRLVKRT